VNYQAVFLGRDGVLIRDRGNIAEPHYVELLPNVGEIVKSINEQEIPVVMVFNEPLIGYNILSRDRLIEINTRIYNLLKENDGAEIDMATWCPHKPSVNCWCRLPAPGLLYAMATKFYLDLRRCIFIGDTEQDIQAAKAVRMKWFKVKKGLADWNPS
jgi:D-glycero-D-manno-heptose 1,7-bisphosphate phosphatase